MATNNAGVTQIYNNDNDNNAVTVAVAAAWKKPEVFKIYSRKCKAESHLNDRQHELDQKFRRWMSSAVYKQRHGKRNEYAAKASKLGMRKNALDGWSTCNGNHFFNAIKKEFACTQSFEIRCKWRIYIKPYFQCSIKGLSFASLGLSLW